MGLVGELLGGLGVEVRQGDLELDGELVAAAVLGTDVDAGADGRVGDVDLARAGHGLQRRVEARGVADGEELLGVGPLARTAHLLGDREVEVEAAVAGPAVPVAAGAGGEGLCGVEGLHRHAPWVGVVLPTDAQNL